MHKVYINTSPTRISSLFQCNTDITESRRDPQFFGIPKSRLFALDKTLPFKGPKLYNAVINTLIRNQTSKNPEKKFLSPFKKMVSCYLNAVQGMGSVEWDTGNFPLYEI